MKLTHAVTHIRLGALHDAKVAALDAVVADYLTLCQHYVTHFCTQAEPDGYVDPCFPSLLSQRWQRVAIQQAAGIARSWQTIHGRAQDDFADRLADRLADWHEAAHAAEETPPVW